MKAPAAPTVTLPGRQASGLSRWLNDRLPFGLAAVALLASLLLPYWSMTLRAPQYPGGLRVAIYLGPQGLVGDVAEVNGLNHYIGMMPLEDAARLERAVAPYGVAALALAAAMAALIRRRWMTVLSLGIVAFPVIFLADLAYWLWYYGNHLDPTAPLRGAIRPFTPPVLGVGRVGQFVVVADFGPGLYLAFTAALLAAAGAVLRWRTLSQARKPAGGL
jgi:copper chaperone NosL